METKNGKSCRMKTLEIRIWHKYYKKTEIIKVWSFTI